MTLTTKHEEGTNVNVRKIAAGIALAGALTVGGYAGVANAQTTSASTATTAAQPSCDKADSHLTKLHHRIDALKDRIAKAEARVGVLRASGHNDRAEKVAKRVEAGKDRLATLQARVTTIEQKCGVSTTPVQP